MKRRLTSLGKGIIGALILLVLAAGSISLAWILSNPDAITIPDSGSKTPNQEQSVSSSQNPVIKTESEPTPTTQTDTETVTSSTSTSLDNTDSDTVQDVPLSEILGQITPPAEGSTKKIAFTFDDGPYDPVTRAIADEFAKYNGHCTFFVVGNRMGDRILDNGVVQYASSLGHEIAIHGYTHTVYYNNCSESAYVYEVETTASRIEAATGKAPALLRPPGGGIANYRVAASPYSIILWNVDTKDYSYSKRTEANINKIVQNIVSATTAGDIILMHDLYYNSLEAIKIVLPALAEQGYEFVTVSELLGDEMQPGKKYNKAY